MNHKRIFISKSLLKFIALVSFVFTCWETNCFAQDTQIKGFADTQAALLKSDTSKRMSHGFALGQLDLFITSQINDKTTFLAETVFEWDGNAFAVDVERVILRYSFNNFFNAAAGKFHTPFGYWSNAYHHGALIQPTIQRPNIVRFEDEGGFLPIHQVGMQLDGSGITNKNIGYSLIISNGQAKGNTGGDFAYQSPVAVGGSVSIEPVENLSFIASTFYNTVPKGTTTYQGILLTEDSKYAMLNGSVSYFSGALPIEFLAEYYAISNTMNSGTSRMGGYFAYIGLKKFKIKPYALYNSIRFENTERYFYKNNLDGLTVGVRYNINQKAVVKLEYTFESTEIEKKQNLLRAQFAVGF